jgi:hypothetical protein
LLRLLLHIVGIIYVASFLPSVCSPLPMVEPVTVAGNAAVTDRAVGRPVAWRMKNPLGLVERAPHLPFAG